MNATSFNKRVSTTYSKEHKKKVFFDVGLEQGEYFITICTDTVKIAEKERRTATIFLGWGESSSCNKHIHQIKMFKNFGKFVSKSQ